MCATISSFMHSFLHKISFKTEVETCHLCAVLDVYGLALAVLGSFVVFQMCKQKKNP